MVAQLDELISRSRLRLHDLDRLRELGIVAKGADFSPSGVHYPPITKYSPISEDEMFAGYRMPADGRLDVYAHIPFCKTRCTFCHYPLKLGPKMVEEKDRYLAALEKEMDLYLRRLGIDRIKPRSILVGGGTPTFLTPVQFRRFLESFNKRVDLLASSQFSYDVDPNTLIGPDGEERLRMMRDFGVHRLTIGIQSLNPEVLRLMNRHHGRNEALEAIEASKKAGFQVNIEFIFGYPGQTLENWAEVVDEACRLDVEEIQLYRLKVEAYGDYQGPIKQVLEKKKQPVPTNEDAIVMKQLAIEILDQHGYREEILRRVFTRHPEHYSHYAHNQCCRLVDEVGFGLTAFSSLVDRFVLNTADFDEYYAKIEAGHLPVNRGLVRSKEDLARWAVVLPLKNRTIRERDFQRVTGGISLKDVFPEKMRLLKEAGLVTDTKWGVTLTTLGRFFADETVQQFFEPDHLPFPADDYMPGPLHPLNNNQLFGSTLIAAE